MMKERGKMKKKIIETVTPSQPDEISNNKKKQLGGGKRSRKRKY